METTVQPNPNPASQPNGIEVKINPGRISIYVIVFYLLCQKYIIKGVAAGAVKG